MTTLRNCWKFHFTWLKTKFKDFGAMAYYQFWVKKGPWRQKPEWVWGHRKVRRIARESYVALYEALASKDEKSIEGFCISGLQSHLQSRFQSRPRHVEMTWKLLKHDRHPRVMSNRMTVYPMPGSDDRNTPSYFRQVVVRLKTRQLLTIERKDPTQSPASGSKKKSKPLVWKPDGVTSEMKEAAEEDAGLVRYERHEQDVVEYVVLQRRMLKGVEEPWKVWGFTERTTLKRLLEDEEAVEAMNRYQQAHPELT
jgi:protein MBA1